jgi:integrase
MKAIEVQNGTRIASAIPYSTDNSSFVQANVESLADLLSHLNSDPTAQTPMFRSTAAKIAAFLGKSIDQITLDLIYANREGFRPFLEGQRYKEGSVRAYVNYLRMLLDAAGRLGWQPHARLSKEWQEVLDVAKKNACVGITKYLQQVKDSPDNITAEDFERWTELRVKQGISYSTTKTIVSRLWRTLVTCGYVKNAPEAVLRLKKVGIHVSKFPEPLKGEVYELLRWKSAEYEPERPSRARLRQVSAAMVRLTFSCVYGFAKNIGHYGEITSLGQLLQKQIIAGYISWGINKQKMKGGPLVTRLACLLAAVSKHPAYKGMDLSWFRPLLNSIPIDSYDEIKARKAKKYLEYDVLKTIPGLIRVQRESEAKRGKDQIARLVMEELMISWLLLLPWRQRNLRECRVEGQSPNLFKAKIPVYSYVDKPTWVRQEEAANPNAEFWQFKFSREETKTGIAVHALIPRQLVGLLELYLAEYRPLLKGNSDCNTLLVGSGANEMSIGDVTDAISDMTLRYGGRRVTPHLFRDIVAYAWLKSHSEDYLTLSKMLWHKNLATTINYYGSRFNESSGVTAMESWTEQCEARKKEK